MLVAPFEESWNQALSLAHNLKCRSVCHVCLIVFNEWQWGLRCVSSIEKAAVLLNSLSCHNAAAASLTVSKSRATALSLL